MVIDRWPIPEIAISSPSKAQKHPAGKGELAGLHHAGEQLVIEWLEVAQLSDDARLLGSGHLSHYPRGEHVGHSHTKSPKRSIVEGFTVGVDEGGGFVEPLTGVYGAAHHDRVHVNVANRAGWAGRDLMPTYSRRRFAMRCAISAVDPSANAYATRTRITSTSPPAMVGHSPPNG